VIHPDPARRRGQRTLSLGGEEPLLAQPTAKRLEPQIRLPCAGGSQIVAAQLVAAALQIHVERAVGEDPQSDPRRQRDAGRRRREQGAADLSNVCLAA